jgi:hypothetical protein
MDTEWAVLSPTKWAELFQVLLSKSSAAALMNGFTCICPARSIVVPIEAPNAPDTTKLF